MSMDDKEIESMEIMTNLLEENCIRVAKGSPALTPSAIQTLMGELTGWQIIDREGTQCLEKSFKFTNFNNALSFTNRIGQLSEDQDHHPVIMTEWGRVTLTWWTHAVHGLHRNDFIMATHSDAIFLASFSD